MHAHASPALSWPEGTSGLLGPPGCVISRRMSLDETPCEIQLFRGKQNDYMKVVLKL
jgi:hypothetical protein